LNKFWGVRFYHVGVVLGNNEICHFLEKLMALELLHEANF